MKKLFLLLIFTLLIPTSGNAATNFRVTTNNVFESGGNTYQYVKYSEQPRIGDASLFLKGETRSLKTDSFDTALAGNDWTINWGRLKDGFTYESVVNGTLLTGEVTTKRKEFTVEQNVDMKFNTNAIRYNRSGDSYDLAFNVPPKEVVADIYREGHSAKIGSIILLEPNSKNNTTSFSFPLRLNEGLFYKISIRAYDKNGDVILSTKEYIPTVLDFKIDTDQVDLIDSNGIYSPNQAAYTVSLTKTASSVTVNLTDRSGNVFHTYSASNVRDVQFLPSQWGSKRLEYDTTYYFKLTARNEAGQEITHSKQFRTGDEPEQLVIVTQPVTSQDGTVTVNAVVIKQQLTLEEMDERASSLLGENYEFNAQEVGEVYNEQVQNDALTRYVQPLRSQYSVTDKRARILANFIAYGVDGNTKELGAGERAAVVNSFAKAYGKLPENRAEIADMIRVSNGRWPENRNSGAELRGKQNFQLIYRRVPNMNNPQDNAAVTILTYGLKQRAENRNLSSERGAIAIFRRIFNQDPNSTEEWNMVQAIAYSGATQKNDTDGDGLSDEDEQQIGTDMFRRDSDNDGFSDGTEVLNGYSPLGR